MTMQVLPYVFQEQLVRARLDEQDNPWFVAKDVCAVLDIQDHIRLLSNWMTTKGVGVLYPPPVECRNSRLSPSPASTR